MRRTTKFMLINKQLNKNKKKTIIGWKTFNSKKIRFILPRLKKIIELINNIIIKLVAYKQKSIIKLLINEIKTQKIFVKLNQKNENSYLKKTNLYNSYFTNEKDVIGLINGQNIEKKANYTNELFQKYMYITKIINHLKKTTVSTLILPPKRTTYTVLRSPHADKKAREQFAKEIYNTKMIINNYVSIMKYLNKIVYFYTRSFITSYKYNIIY